MPPEPPPDLIRALHRMGLLPAGADAQGEPLTGGVSSDIWRIDTPAGPICVKRALGRLRVAAEWQAPISRNLYEARWMRAAAAILPSITPRLLGQDPESGTLAMEYLRPDDHPLWKTRLRDGITDAYFAARVGGALARIHAATAADPAIAADFPTDAIFHDIRLEPYLIATGRAHPDLAERLQRLAATTQAHRLALVHGDVSPKNILCGPRGPVLLDAECAWWGDPAFDLAFCLNHLLLKCLWTPSATAGFLACFDAMATSYRPGITWEPLAAFEARAAALLPGLFLARVDGKSPVEYITAEADRDRVRRVARALLLHPPTRLAAIREAWTRELAP